MAVSDRRLELSSDCLDMCVGSFQTDKTAWSSNLCSQLDHDVLQDVVHDHSAVEGLNTNLRVLQECLVSSSEESIGTKLLFELDGASFVRLAISVSCSVLQVFCPLNELLLDFFCSKKAVSR
jgi:hypothetical protein